MYTITLFPDATLVSGSPDDKRRIAPHATIGTLRTTDSFEQVVEWASTQTVSLNEYSRSEKCHPNQVHRHGDYFVSTNLIGLDVDDNITIQEALERLRGLGWKFGLYTSFNHQTTGTDKFRVVLELDGKITDPTIYRNTWESIHAEFLGLDKSCKDVARLYFHSNPETRQVFVENGKLVPIVSVAPHRATKFGPTTPTASNKPDAAGFEQINVRAKLPIDVRNWMVGIDEYGEPIAFEAGGRNAQFFKVVNLAKERGYDRDWCDERLGKTLRDDDDYMRTYGDSKIQATLDQIFSRESRHQMPTLFGFGDLDGPRAFINSWLKSKSITVDRNGSLVSGVTKWSPKQLLHTILLDYDEHNREYNRAEEQKPKDLQRKVRRIGRDAIESAVVEYVSARRNEHRAKLIEAIEFCGNDGNLSELKKFVFAMCGKDDETSLAVLAHFIWQVKRKAFHLPVQYHMMPILTGVQGNGKSTATEKFLAPVKDFMTRSSLADLADKKRGETFQYNYVAFCDEMEQANRTDIDGLKNFITAPKINVREMYSPHELEYAQNCTPIGCTNRSLATLIYDPTGMRRFFEILTDPKLKTNGWHLLDKINYLKMWQQIDENIPGPDCYIIPLMDQILSHQEELRVESPIESFLIESGAMPIEGEETVDTNSDEFFADYRMFSAKNGHKTKDKSFFGKHLVNFGITKHRKSVGTRRPYFYTVNAKYQPLNDLT